MAKLVGMGAIAVVGDRGELEVAPSMMTSRMAVKVDQENVFISKIGKGKS